MESEPQPVIQIRWPGGEVEERPISADVLHIGRAPANDIVINFPTVSGRHLRLTASRGRVRIADLHSTNGTLLNGRFITPDEPADLWPGDVVRIGDFLGNSIAFSLCLPHEAGRQLRSVALTDLGGAEIVVIGRDPGCALPLDHPSVSRQHARLVFRDGRHELEDLGSTNGTFVNGRAVTAPVPLGFGDQIQIGPFVLAYDPEANSVQSAVSRGHRLDTIGLGVMVAGRRMILQDVSLTVMAGEFVALVGGSGAGKSTLMKAMNGYNRASQGQMLIDGRELYMVLDAYRTHMGFVPQDDIIHRELPVRLALWHAARLRLPDAGAEEINRRIADVLATVEMSEHADKPVRVLSGGQRKRVSIAVELLPQPSLLFLDEPTSGLDPGLEKKMMYDLNRLADNGRTVVLVTHATANIEQCHHVAFLAQGRLAYYGPPNDAIKFFGARDFADIYLKLSSEVQTNGVLQVTGGAQPSTQIEGVGEGTLAPASPGAFWADQYRRSPYHEKYVAERQAQYAEQVMEPVASAAPPRPTRRDSAWRQMGVLARRQLDLIRHDWRTLAVLLLIPPAITVLFVVVSGRFDLVGPPVGHDQMRTELREALRGAPVDQTAGNVPVPAAATLITMMCLLLTQAGTFGAAFEIVKERAIFKRERAVNLKVSAYVLSKGTVLGLFAVVQVALSVLVLALGVEMPSNPVFGILSSGTIEIYVTLLLSVLASIMFGLFISAIVPSADVVVYVILAQMFIQIVLAGTLFPLPPTLASRFTISYWSVEGMGSTAALRDLNEDSQTCRVIEVPGPGGTTISCNDTPLAEKDLKLDYSHTPAHLLRVWLGLLAHLAFWGLATMYVQLREQPD